MFVGKNQQPRAYLGHNEQVRSRHNNYQSLATQHPSTCRALFVHPPIQLSINRRSIDSHCPFHVRHSFSPSRASNKVVSRSPGMCNLASSLSSSVEDDAIRTGRTCNQLSAPAQSQSLNRLSDSPPVKAPDVFRGNSWYGPATKKSKPS